MWILTRWSLCKLSQRLFRKIPKYSKTPLRLILRWIFQPVMLMLNARWTSGIYICVKYPAPSLETDIREKGLNLSVGQKQRLALARGIIRCTFKFIGAEDEPTSSVDLPTEKSIFQKVIEYL